MQNYNQAAPQQYAGGHGLAPGAAPGIMPQGNMSAQHDMMGNQQITASAGTADTAMAAQVQAQVQARYAMAMRNPRSWLVVRKRLLDSCCRAMFADSARYSKPTGGKAVVGWSIRFAEEAVRAMTNVMPEQVTIYDDSQKRIVRILVTDLEANATYSQDVIIEKTVERRQLRPNQQAIATRTNSQGQPVYIVAAAEGELDNKQAAAVSKMLRNLILRLLPGDIADECLEQINKTRRGEIMKNPTEQRKKLVDAFAVQGVEPKQLADYLGIANLEDMQTDDIENLRDVYTGIKSGEVRWREVVDAKRSDEANDGEPTNRAAAVRSKMQRKGKVAAKNAEPEVDDNGEVLDDDSTALIAAARASEAAKGDEV